MTEVCGKCGGAGYTVESRRIKVIDEKGRLIRTDVEETHNTCGTCQGLGVR